MSIIKSRKLIVFATLLLLISILLTIPAFTAQPPVNNSTLTSGDFKQKYRIKVAIHIVKGTPGGDSNTALNWLLKANEVWGCSLEFYNDEPIHFVDNATDRGKTDEPGAINIYVNTTDTDGTRVSGTHDQHFIVMTPIGTDGKPISGTALAHELGHWFGLEHNENIEPQEDKKDMSKIPYPPENIEHPDNSADGKSGQRTDQAVTDAQQAAVRKKAKQSDAKGKAVKDGFGFETDEPSEDVPSFIDLTYTSVWTDGLLLHLSLAVDNYSSANCELGFEINSSGNSYFIGFNPAYNATIFRTNGVDGNTSLVGYEFDYYSKDLDVPPVITGISLTLPLFKLSPSPTIYYNGIGKYGATVDTAPVHSIQVPNGIFSSQYLLSRTGMPVTLDPALAYDTASGEIIQDVYQTLIWFGDKHPVIFTPGFGHNLTASEYADLGSFTPVLAKSVPTTANGGVIINASGSYWTFTVNTNAQFPEWTAGNGTVMPARNVTADDVVYSFQRQLVYDSPAAPTWMFFEPALGIKGWSAELGDGPYSTYDNGTFKNTADEIAAGISITSWCYKGPGPNDVTFHFQNAWTEVTMNQIFAQTWSSILNKDWVIEHGGWNGNFYAGWTNDYHWKPTITHSELDVYKDPAVYDAAGSKYTTGNHDLPNMLGTGPYLFTSWSKATTTWRIDYNPAYWMGFANAGDKKGNYIHTVIEQEINAWPTRKMLFLEGEFDVATVLEENMYDLLAWNEYTPIPGINLVYNIDVEMARWFARDWVQGWYYNALLPGLYAYDLYKSPPATVQNVDLSLSLTPIVNYSTIYIFHKQMRVGGGLGNGDQPIIPMSYTLTVTRIDGNGGLVCATLGVTRTPGEFPDAKEFGNGTFVFVAALGSASVPLTWYEDGSFQNITGASWKAGGITYTVGGESYPLTSNANDTDLSNNKVTSGTFVAKTLPGDVDGNGVVDIYDALKLAGAFNSSTGQNKYNADADLNSDGTIDIYDAIILSSNFNKNVLTA